MLGAKQFVLCSGTELGVHHQLQQSHSHSPRSMLVPILRQQNPPETFVYKRHSPRPRTFSFPSLSSLHLHSPHLWHHLPPLPFLRIPISRFNPTSILTLHFDFLPVLADHHAFIKSILYLLIISFAL